ncbi:hypothetical protein AcV5_003614 [Taiwanofungus camphoratus]|nr:hypothetical protein AcV5_003614 [Antrodia cinnamomea]
MIEEEMKWDGRPDTLPQNLRFLSFRHAQLLASNSTSKRVSRVLQNRPTHWAKLIKTTLVFHYSRTCMVLQNFTYCKFIYSIARRTPPGGQNVVLEYMTNGVGEGNT